MNIARFISTVALALAISLPACPAAARGARHSSATHHYSHTKRSSQAKTTFKHQHPCPANGKSSGPCPGYVVDHVVPLKRGGADAPSNMQWQTKSAAKAKDKWE